MSEVFRSVDEPVSDSSGSYHPRVVGRQASDGMWEGWLEFVPLDGQPGGVIISPVESRQPERGHLAYWSSGLSAVYIEGALQRARRPVTVRARVIELPASDGPAARMVTLPPRIAGP